jgi:transcriptional regulator with XRE-family HTH domain
MVNEALRLIRVFHDLKQFAAAEKLGISPSFLSEIEKGRKEPTLELLKRYEQVFGISRSSILFFSERLEDGSRSGKVRNAVAAKVIKMLNLLADDPEEESGDE